MRSDVIKLSLVNLTSLRTTAYATLRGKTLKNYEEKVLEPEIQRLEAQIPDFNVEWCKEVYKYGLFVK